MQPIQINVSVNIGLTQELNGLLLSMLNRTPMEAAAPEPVVVAAKKTRTAKQPTEQAEETQTETAAPAEVAAEEQPTKEYTEEDVRAAIDRTRRRIEGEAYKENPDSEGYKKWHRALNSWFKATSALWGADKPSLLPDSESRAKFIACCDKAYVENGIIVKAVLF